LNQSIGNKYDKIAKWWDEEHKNSNYGVSQIERAIKFCKKRNNALDIGCGSGGRITNKLISEGFKVTGVDASIEMIKLAKQKHPSSNFIHSDICNWNTDKKFDLVIAWDSIFHLPLKKQKPVLNKLCKFTAKNGILIYTFGDDIGQHTSNWKNDTFNYSSIGVNENLKILLKNKFILRHLESDQFPEKHMYIIAMKYE